MPEKHDDNITFTINQVAKRIGVVPATIRNWEKAGLITVRRSENNYRIFTLDDIATLQKIKEYSMEKHMGAQAIKMLLPAQSASDVETYVEQQKESCYSRKLLSEKWREIRKQQGYTLDEVSRATGISVAHLCNLENGGNVSLDLMNQLAHFYHENPLYFMKPTTQDNHVVRSGCGDVFKLKNDPGVELRSLVDMREHVMYPVFCKVEPGCGNLVPHAHNGEEMLYMFTGVVEIKLNDEEPYILHPGDTFYYRGTDTHSWCNISPKPATLLWIHCSVSK